MTAVSFSIVRTTIVNTIKEAAKTRGLTPSMLAGSLNTSYGKDIISVERVYEIWTKNTLPSLYQLYKICEFLDLSVDSMFMRNPTVYSSAVPTSINTSASNTISNNSQQDSSMKTTNTIALSKNTRKQYREVVAAHTTSKNYNLILAHKIYNSNMPLKEIARKVGISTRSLRDYALYGMSVNAKVVDQLVALFKTTPRNLGLSYDATRDRYNHLKVVTKA